METQSLSKFCPVCKLGNPQNALVCDHCGAVLVDLKLNEDRTTQNIPERRAVVVDDYKKELNAPSQGMAFFLFGKTEPFAIKEDQTIYLGRFEGDTNEVFIDLNPFDGFAQGVSRRHALIQRFEDRCEIMDLHSSNGTYLNGTRITPNQAYELKSGTVIQLGRLKLIAIFSWPSKR